MTGLFSRARAAFVVLPFIGGLLAACGGPDPVALPRIGFDGGPSVFLEADRPIEVVDIYRPPLSAPHVEHRYRIAPAQIARAWVRDRLGLSGSGGSVKLTIADASVVQEELRVRGGILGFFRHEPEARLIARLEVVLDYAAHAGRAASTRVAVDAIHLLPEGYSESDLERAYFQVLQELADRLDAEMSKQLRQDFRPVFQRAA